MDCSINEGESACSLRAWEAARPEVGRLSNQRGQWEDHLPSHSGQLIANLYAMATEDGHDDLFDGIQ